MGVGGVKLPPRSTRGRRMTQMLEDEDSADEAFWGQDAFKEDEADEAYESEDEVLDEFDKDFDRSESDEADDDDEVEGARERVRKTLKAPERGSKKKNSAAGAGKATTTTTTTTTTKEKTANVLIATDTKTTSAADDVNKTKEGEEVENQKQQENEKNKNKKKVMFDVTAEIRVSARAGAKESRQRSEILRAERESKPAVVRTKVEYKIPTMEEMIREAKITERENLIELEHLLHLEEMQKKKNSMMDRKKRYDGPAIRQRTNKDGGFVYEMLRGAMVCKQDVPEFYLEKPYNKNNNISNAEAIDDDDNKKKASTTMNVSRTCAITGLPAKYRDPKTGSYYATIDAFKQLRIQHEKELEEKKESNNIEADEKMDNEEEQPPKRASIWDPPIPGELTHRDIMQLAKKKAEAEERAAMLAFTQQQEALKAERLAMRIEKQQSKAFVPQKQSKADLKKAQEAMKIEEEKNKAIRGPGRWLSLKTIMARPELDVPSVGAQHPRPVLEEVSKSEMPAYRVTTPLNVAEKPVDDKPPSRSVDVKIEQPNFTRFANSDIENDDSADIEGPSSRMKQKRMESADIVAIKSEEEEDDNAEDDAMTNSDDYTMEDCSEEDEDDEQTLSEDERAIREDDDEVAETAEEERKRLEDEAAIPIEELMRRYQSKNRQFGEKEQSPSPENSSDFDEDASDEDSEDDEGTIEEDELALREEEDGEDVETAEDERKRLEDEANIPIEELMRRYQNQ